MKIFKNLRKYYLDQSKFRKYILYALGEIILIVIGILVAIQITNIKDQKSLKSTKANSLKLISEAIATDTIIYNGLLNMSNRFERKKNGLKLAREYYRGNFELGDSYKDTSRFISNIIAGVHIVDDFKPSSLVVLNQLMMEGKIAILDDEIRNEVDFYHNYMLNYKRENEDNAHNYWQLISSYLPFAYYPGERLYDRYDINRLLEKMKTEEFYGAVNSEFVAANLQEHHILEAKYKAKIILYLIQNNKDISKKAAVNNG